MMSTPICLNNGERICGFDFGTNRNHIVYGLIEIDETASHGFRIIDWNYLCFGEKVTLPVIAKNMISTLQATQILTAQWYILEVQSPRNTKAHCIAYMLAAILGQASVVHMAPATKFTVLDPQKIHLKPERITKRKLKDTREAKDARLYRRRKQWAIALCDTFIPSERWVLVKDPRNSANTIVPTKKDDLADALLYAIAFYQQNRGTVIIPMIE